MTQAGKRSNPRGSQKRRPEPSKQPSSPDIVRDRASRLRVAETLVWTRDIL